MSVDGSGLDAVTKPVRTPRDRLAERRRLHELTPMKHSIFRFGVAALLLACGARIAFAKVSPRPLAPPFSTVQEHGVWYLKSPAGAPFFSRGVCCVLAGDTAATFNPKNPSYASFQEYPSNAAWASATLERLKSWGFTTIGGWSDIPALSASPQMDMPFTVMIPIGMSVGAPWLDMWDPKIIAGMDRSARQAILPVRNNPNLIGYFTDNELGWWKGALIQTTLTKQPSSSVQRQKLVTLLRTHYHGSWTDLCKDFVPVGVGSFAQLGSSGTVFLRPGGNGMGVESRFLSMMAARYYSLVHSLVRKYDKRGLILGDRYQSFYYPEVAAAASPYVDVLSTNVNASWADGGLARFYLPNLHSLSHRPVMVTEFYVASTQNRSGNKNDSSGFVVVPTQAQRARVFSRQMQQFLAEPFVVGADWFQYFDEPSNGRGDGEDYDMGLVDIRDRPYAQLTQASAHLNVAKWRAAGLEPQDSILTHGVPVAPDNPLSGKDDKTMLLHWNREAGFVPSESATPMADMYMCWDSGHLYLGVYAIDPVEKDNYKSGDLPAQDAPVLTLRLAHRAPITVRFIDGQAPRIVGAPQGFDVRHYGPQDNVRNSTIVIIPASLLGHATLTAGDTVTLSADLVSHARAYRTDWTVSHAALSGR